MALKRHLTKDDEKRFIKRLAAIVIACGLGLTAGPSVVQALAEVVSDPEPKFQVEQQVQ